MAGGGTKTYAKVGVDDQFSKPVEDMGKKAEATAKKVDRLRDANGRFSKSGAQAGSAATIFGVKIGSIVPNLSGLTSNLVHVGKTLTSLASYALAPFGAALSGAMGSLSVANIKAIDSKFEQIQVDIAQTLGFMGRGGNSFEDAMGNSASVMRRLVKDAGPLPGGAEAYMKAMATAGSVVQGATHDYEKSYQLIKTMTAITKGDGVASANFLRQAFDAVGGHLRAAQPLTQQMIATMNKLPGVVGMTAASFNKLALEKRIDLVTRATGLFNAKIAASAGTFDAKAGAAQSAWEWLIHAASPKFFDAMKGSMDAVTDSILDSKGQFTPLAQDVIWVGELIGSTISKAAKGAIILFAKIRQVIDGIGHSQTFGMLTRFADKIGKAFIGQKPGSAGGGGAGGAMQASSGFDRILAAVVPVVVALDKTFASMIATISDGISTFGPPLVSIFVGLVEHAGKLAEAVLPRVGALFESLVSLGGTLFTGFIAVWSSVADVLLDAATSILPPLMNTFTMLSDAIRPVIAGAYDFANQLIQKLRPYLDLVWKAIGNLIDAIGTMLVPIIGYLGTGLSWLYSILNATLIPVLQGVAQVAASLINAFAAIVRWVAQTIGANTAPGGVAAAAAAAGKAFGAGGVGAAPGALGVSGAPTLSSGAGGTGAAAAIGARGGGGKTVQDFRYSHFEIDQKFEEGFDPDRIAVAFAQDVGRIGEHRLQSSFEPAMSVK